MMEYLNARHASVNISILRAIRRKNLVFFINIPSISENNIVCRRFRPKMKAQLTGLYGAVSVYFLVLGVANGKWILCCICDLGCY
jgi:hypothetical protein